MVLKVLIKRIINYKEIIHQELMDYVILKNQKDGNLNGTNKENVNINTFLDIKTMKR